MSEVVMARNMKQERKSEGGESPAVTVNKGVWLPECGPSRQVT